MTNCFIIIVNLTVLWDNSVDVDVDTKWLTTLHRLKLRSQRLAFSSVNEFSPSIRVGYF
jgi:hypothetical protein